MRSWNTIWNSGAGITNQSRTVYEAANGYRYVTNIALDNSYSVAITRYGTQSGVGTAWILHLKCQDQKVRMVSARNPA